MTFPWQLRYYWYVHVKGDSVKRIIVAFMLALAALPSLADAQSTPVTASYPAGYNMVGGPTGTVFSGATLLEGYAAGNYFVAPSPVAAACVGYFAFFVDPTTITIPPSPETSRYCSLQAGWNIVGNPFSAAATLPSGVLAYYLSPASGTYAHVTTIPPGGAVWIYSPTTSNILLNSVQVQTVVPTTVTVSSLPAGPFRLHVGDSIKILLPTISNQQVTVSSNLLTLEDSGTTGNLSCIGDPSCAISLVNQFWTYLAVNPGTAYITVTGACQAGTTCTPSGVIEVDILP